MHLDQSPQDMIEVIAQAHTHWEPPARLVFSKAERRALLRAGKIASQARALVGEETTLGYELARIETALDFAEDTEWLVGGLLS